MRSTKKKLTINSWNWFAFTRTTQLSKVVLFILFRSFVYNIIYNRMTFSLIVGFLLFYHFRWNYSKRCTRLPFADVDACLSSYTVCTAKKKQNYIKNCKKKTTLWLQVLQFRYVFHEVIFIAVLYSFYYEHVNPLTSRGHRLYRNSNDKYLKKKKKTFAFWWERNNAVCCR